MRRHEIIELFTTHNLQLYTLISYAQNKREAPPERSGVYAVLINGLENTTTLVRASSKVRVCVNQLIAQINRGHLNNAEFNFQALDKGFKVYWLETDNQHDALLVMLKLKAKLLEGKVLAPYCFMDENHKGWLK